MVAPRGNPITANLRVKPLKLLLLVSLLDAAAAATASLAASWFGPQHGDLNGHREIGWGYRGWWLVVGGWWVEMEWVEGDGGRLVGGGRRVVVKG